MFKYDQSILSLLLESIEKIETYTKPFSNARELVANAQAFDATLMNFIAISGCVNRLSEYFKTSHPEIEWRKIYAFRNLIAHVYFGIDEDEVWDIVQNHLPDLKLKIENITYEALG